MSVNSNTAMIMHLSHGEGYSEAIFACQWTKILTSHCFVQLFLPGAIFMGNQMATSEILTK